MNMKKILTGTMIAACVTVFSLPAFAATGTATKVAAKTNAPKVVTADKQVKTTKKHKSAKKSSAKAAATKKADAKKTK